VVLLEPVNADPVHPTRASVFSHTLPCPRQVTRIINLSDQRVFLPHLHTFPRYLISPTTIPSILGQRRLGHCLSNHQPVATYSLSIALSSPFPPWPLPQIGAL
jgi:hypothetical protein